MQNSVCFTVLTKLLFWLLKFRGNFVFGCDISYWSLFSRDSNDIKNFEKYSSLSKKITLEETNLLVFSMLVFLLFFEDNSGQISLTFYQNCLNYSLNKHSSRYFHHTADWKWLILKKRIYFFFQFFNFCSRNILCYLHSNWISFVFNDFIKYWLVFGLG